MHLSFARAGKMLCSLGLPAHPALWLLAIAGWGIAAVTPELVTATSSAALPLGSKWVDKIGGESGLRKSEKTCPEFRFETPSGTIHVRESRIGETPDIILPKTCEYVGLPPESLECAWVNRACDVGSVTASEWGNCWNIYNITRRHRGLRSWPDDLTPLLVSGVGGREVASIASSSFEGQDLDDTLPPSMHASDFICQSPPAELDFASAKMSHGAGALIYRGLVRGEPQQRTVDLIISKEGSLRAPTGQYASAGGRIVMTRGDGETSFKFQFVDSMSQIPVTLGKVFITLFDIDNGLDRKEITVAGLSAYYLSSDTWLKGREYTAGLFRFSSGEYQPGEESDSTLDGMWRNSQRRTVVLAFEDLSEFTLNVRPLPCSRCHSAEEGEECYDNAKWAKDQGVFEHPEWYPGLTSNSSQAEFQMNLFKHGMHKCQRPCEWCNTDSFELRLEFAGWSNLVQVGRKVQCATSAQLAKYSLFGRSRGALRSSSFLLQVICFSLAAVAVTTAAFAIAGRASRIDTQVRALEAMPWSARTRTTKRGFHDIRALIAGIGGELRRGGLSAHDADTAYHVGEGMRVRV
jgi:hypothetical protein